MSSKKRVKSNPKANTVVEVADAADSEDTANINILPAEIILRILSNLSHGDLLWNRLVCTKWNDVVRTDQTFLRKSLIRVCANSENKNTGRDVLENSNVNWKHLHLIDVKYFGTGRAFPVEIPFYLREEVQTLKISHSNMSWKGYQHIVTQFPTLKELTIKRTELSGTSAPTKKGRKIVSAKSQPEFEAVLNKLTSLSIGDCELPAINVFLSRLQRHLKCLTTFAIRANAHDDISLLLTHGANLYQGLFEVIHGNSKSLKNLDMTICGMVSGVIETNFGNVIRRLNESPTATSSLNLDMIYLRYSIFHDDFDLQALVQFLKINKNVKRICLPEISIPRYSRNSAERNTMVQTFMTSLPKDIVQVEVPTTSYFQGPHNGSLFNSFDKLELIHIHQKTPPSHPLLQGFTSSHVQNFRICRIRNLRDIQRLTDAFPYLVHLEAKISRVTFSESIVQHICKHMRLLVSLDLDFDAWSDLTDSAITGIKPSYCRFLQKLNPKTLGDMEVPAEEMNGCPLSSLRRLERLSIMCTFRLITDVGLCFGFRFPHLKHLSLLNFGEPTITPVGLNYLADFNKSLERVTLNEIVSKNRPLHQARTKEIEEFKLRLDRCKHFRMNIKLSRQAHWNIFDDSNPSLSEGNEFSDSGDSPSDDIFSSSSSGSSESGDTSDD